VHVDRVGHYGSAGNQRDVGKVTAHEMAKIRGEFGLDREVQHLVGGIGEVHLRLDRCGDVEGEIAAGEGIEHVITEPLPMTLDGRSEKPG
jgi:hypothetical protein